MNYSPELKEAMLPPKNESITRISKEKGFLGDYTSTPIPEELNKTVVIFVNEYTWFWGYQIW